MALRPCHKIPRPLNCMQQADLSLPKVNTRHREVRKSCIESLEMARSIAEGPLLPNRAYSYFIRGYSKSGGLQSQYKEALKGGKTQKMPS